jgi:hypothetical protein
LLYSQNPHTQHVWNKQISRLIRSQPQPEKNLILRALAIPALLATLSKHGQLPKIERFGHIFPKQKKKEGE